MDNPYRARGTLTGRSYIERDADIELRTLIQDNDRYPFFLAPRQSGKSSVMEWARISLTKEDLKIVVIDLSIFPRKTLDDFDIFMFNFIFVLFEKLGINGELKSQLRYLKGQPMFLLESIRLLLRNSEGRIIACIDELDMLLASDFRDDFLSQIRALFNERASDQSLERIQFVLAAAVSLDSLISDTKRSPFNVGSRVFLRDFNKEQIHRLVEVGDWLSPEEIELACDRIHYWTSGSVFLSQSLLEKAYPLKLRNEKQKDISDLVDDVALEIINSAAYEVHFKNIERQLKRQPRLLSSWKDWIEGIASETTISEIKEYLILTGISDENNPVRNRIYRRVFLEEGPLPLLPKAEGILRSDAPPLNSAEKFFISAINNKDLVNNIIDLKKAVQDILIPSNRLQQDYLYHDIKHSERLVDIIDRLLKTNERFALKGQEIYLLLAGIYLHDIGMQCDVARNPEIKRKAEQMGAKFITEFQANNINQYDDIEKRSIRENHQYLSAAWICYAFRSNETSLSKAISKIPTHLISDLAEICKYHSKLPINNCTIASRSDSTIRVQFLAALLRFANELDIDRNKIYFNEINLFKSDPYNAIYWWLNNIVDIIYANDSVIVLIIRLNSEDFIKFSSIIYNNFILEFQTKNHPTITILRQNGIFIKISPESSVIEDHSAEPLPSDIKYELVKLANKSDKVNTLAYEVRTWLRALSYEIDDILRIDNDIAEMVASTDLGASEQRILVSCYNRELLINDINEIQNRINIETPNGLLISNKMISLRVSNYSYTKKNIRIFYINDFLQQLIWGNYFNSLRSLVERDLIHERYIDLSCYQESFDDGPYAIINYPSLDGFIDKWLREEGKTHISVLGDFGTGKTWFCRHYASRQLLNYLNDPINERVPLLITLREFSKVFSAKQLINDALIEQYKLPFKGSAYDVFEDLNRRGKLLLILDGFDEMARKVDYQTIVDNFWELTKLIEQNSKVILTSRTEYFRQLSESEKILEGEEFGRKTIELSPLKFEILNVDTLSDTQIRKLIGLRRGEKEGVEDADLILSRSNLAEMARKPVLIDLLLAAIDEVGKNDKNLPQNTSQVYLYATNKLMMRNITTERTFTSTTDKLYFLCELAWEMVRSGNLNIHFSAIPDIINKYFGNKIKGKGELDNWDFDLRTQTLLHRDANGYYEFAHKSLAEFFVAFKFVAELGCLSHKFKDTYLGDDLKPTEIPYRPKNIMQLAETFGALSLLDSSLSTVREFLIEMIADDAPGTLWRIIDESSDKTPNEVKFCGGNAAIMLQDMGIWSPLPYKDITDLLQRMIVPQEHVFPPSPAKKDNLEKALYSLGFNVKKKKITKKQIDNALDCALKAYNLLNEGKIVEAYELVESNKMNYPRLRDFYVSLLSYAGVQSLYLGNFNEAEQYFIRFKEVGGNKHWSDLKICETRLYNASIGTNSTLISDLREKTEIILQESIEYGDFPNEAKALFFLGILDRIEHRYNACIDKFMKARELFIREHDISRIGISFANIAFTYRLIGNYEDSISNYDKAINIFAGIKDKSRLACAKVRRGSAHRALKSFDKAIDDYESAIAIFQDHDELRKVVALRELGTTYLMLGKWDGAIYNYNFALRYFNRSDIMHYDELISKRGQTLYGLGLAYLMQTKWKQSIAYFEDALEIFQERCDDYNISLALSSIGIAFVMTNSNSDALKYFIDALKVVEKIHDKNRECLLITQISDIHLKMHNYNLALREYNHALKIAEALDDNRLKGNIIGQIGITYRLMNNVESAEQYFKQALEIFMDQGDMAKISWMLEEIGQLYIKQGFYNKAIDEYNKSLKCLNNTDRALLDDNLVNIVEGYVLQAIHKGEIKKYEAALWEIERFGSLGLRCKILRNLGEAYRRSGKYEMAEKYLKESLKIAKGINDKTQEGKTLCYLGLTFAGLSHVLRGMADAIAYDASTILNIEESLKIFRDMGDHFLEGWVLENIGRVYLMRGSWYEALDNYQKALKFESKSGFIHLGLAICYKNLSDKDSYKNECILARKLLSVEGMNEFSLACLEAICGTQDKSIKLLELALKKGQTNFELISQDPFLIEILKNPRFKALQSKSVYHEDIEMPPFM